jgi:hypothetical protein
MDLERPQKTWKLNHWNRDRGNTPFFQLSGNEPEAKMAANQKTFISAREGGISISPGPGNNVNFQGLSHNMKYGGMIQDLPFPMSMIPITPFTPFPLQTFSPPLKELVPIIAQLSVMASSFVGV